MEHVIVVRSQDTVLQIAHGFTKAAINAGRKDTLPERANQSRCFQDCKAKVAKVAMWSTRKELEKEVKEKVMDLKDKVEKAKAISNLVHVIIVASSDIIRKIVEHRRDMVLEFRL